LTAPINPVPLSNTAGYIFPAVLSTYQDFYSVPPQLQALATQMIYIAPSGQAFHLAGANAGSEGVTLGQQLQGEQHLPFEQVTLEGAYQFGATIERQNYPKRLINLRVVIGGENFSAWQYQMCDNRWWDGQDETQDGWLGVKARFTPWRWIPVRPYKTVDTAQRIEPLAFGNNTAIWDINWICQRPYYTEPPLWKTWFAAQSGQPNKAGLYTGQLTVANRGNLTTHVQYLIDGEGVATVQDNSSTTMVTLPEMIATDGPGLCDTDPANRTLTASNDPADNALYDWLRSSEILNYFLTNLTMSDQPWWERGYVRFLYTIPPNSVTTFNVQHTNPKATITAILQQRFKRSR
jgi:hypothetical protein